MARRSFFALVLALSIAFNTHAALAQDAAKTATMRRAAENPSDLKAASKLTSRSPLAPAVETPATIGGPTITGGNPAIIFRCQDVEGFGYEFTRDCPFGQSITGCRRDAERDTREKLRAHSDQIPGVTNVECLLSNRTVGKCTRSSSRASIRTISYYDETTHTVYGEMFYTARFRCRG